VSEEGVAVVVVEYETPARSEAVVAVVWQTHPHRDWYARHKCYVGPLPGQRS
jgi:hypothetical protein